jgi:hypothetical protein
MRLHWDCRRASTDEPIASMVNNCMEQSPSWAAGSRSASLQNSPPLMEPEGSLLCSQEPPLDHTLSRRNPVHTLPPDTFILSSHHNLPPDTFMLSSHHTLPPDTFILSFHHTLPPDTFILSSHHTLPPGTFILSSHHTLPPGTSILSFHHTLPPDTFILSSHLRLGLTGGLFPPLLWSNGSLSFHLGTVRTCRLLHRSTVGTPWSCGWRSRGDTSTGVGTHRALRRAFCTPRSAATQELYTGCSN